MSEATFETQLTKLLREYSEGGVRPIDRSAIAEETIAGGTSSKRWRLTFDLGQRPIFLVIVGLLVLALAASVALVASRLLLPPPVQIRHTYTDQLTTAAELVTPMFRPVLVPFQDGHVLVIGSSSSGVNASTTAVLYDPLTGTSQRTGPMLSPERGVTSALQLMDGRVLVLGDGVNQIFDPTTMQFAPVGQMVTRRSSPAAALLHDGRVLIAGGLAPTGSAEVGTPLGSAELFDPATLASTPTGPVARPTGYGHLVTLPDGMVFMAKDPAELYDPAMGTFSAATSAASGGGGYPVVLPDGRVVLAGSTGLYEAGSINVWDPTSRNFIYNRLSEPLTGATLLDDGRILVIGMCRGRQTGWTGLYDPSTRTTTPGPVTNACRPAATRLADGRVLIAGGDHDLNALSTVEIFR